MFIELSMRVEWNKRIVGINNVPRYIYDIMMTGKLIWTTFAQYIVYNVIFKITLGIMYIIL